MPMLPDELSAGDIDLRRWRTTDLEEVRAAVALSFSELQQWMAWAQVVPTKEALRAAFESGEAAFDADEEWQYVLRECASGEIVGGAGLHRRGGPAILEIGYWVRSDRTGRGYATAAARALTMAAFRYVPDVHAVEIHMDEANVASTAVPRKLHFRLDRKEDREVMAISHTGKGFVWVCESPPGRS